MAENQVMERALDARLHQNSSLCLNSGGKQLLPGSLCHQNTWGLRTGSLFLLNTHGLSLNTSRKCGCIFIDSARFNDLGGM